MNINTQITPVENKFLRIHQILEIIPISKATWWAKVKSGEYPQPIKHGGLALWLASDIQELVNSIISEGGRSRV